MLLPSNPRRAETFILAFPASYIVETGESNFNKSEERTESAEPCLFATKALKFSIVYQ